MCFRKKPISPSTSKSISSIIPYKVPKEQFAPVIIPPTMKYLVERYVVLCEHLTEENWRIPIHTELLYEANRIAGLIIHMPRKTKEHKRLYRIFKKYDKHIDNLLKVSPIESEMVRTVAKVEPIKPWWHTKVERIDDYGRVLSTQYLG